LKCFVEQSLLKDSQSSITRDLWGNVIDFEKSEWQEIISPLGDRLPSKIPEDGMPITSDTADTARYVHGAKSTSHRLYAAMNLHQSSLIDIIFNLKIY